MGTLVMPKRTPEIPLARMQAITDEIEADKVMDPCLCRITQACSPDDLLTETTRTRRVIEGSGRDAEWRAVAHTVVDICARATVRRRGWAKRLIATSEDGTDDEPDCLPD